MLEEANMCDVLFSAPSSNVYPENYITLKVKKAKEILDSSK